MYNLFKKNKWNIIFWASQVLYWGYFSLNGYYQSYFVEGYTFSDWHKAGSIIDFLTTLFLVGVLRFFLKKFLSWEQFKLNDILKVIIIIFLGALVWSPLHSNTGHWLQITFFPGKVYPEALKGGDPRVRLFVLCIQMAGWTVSYICLKVFVNYNAQRLKVGQLTSSFHEARLSNLKNQINPHFLFNNLNNIRGLMLEDPEKSRNMLTKLSEVLQHALQKNQLDTIFLTEELKMIEHYISLSKMQFESRLQYSQKVNPKVLDYKIPPMIIQLLIENAIKHGISNIKKGGFINLDIDEYQNKLHIKVVNSGNLKVEKKSTAVGLKNITERLKFIYGSDAIFALKEKENNVIAQIELPVNV